MTDKEKMKKIFGDYRDAIYWSIEEGGKVFPPVIVIEKIEDLIQEREGEAYKKGYIDGSIRQDDDDTNPRSNEAKSGILKQELSKRKH